MWSMPINLEEGLGAWWLLQRENAASKAEPPMPHAWMECSGVWSHASQSPGKFEFLEIHNTIWQHHFNGLVQERHNPSALAILKPVTFYKNVGRLNTLPLVSYKYCSLQSSQHARCWYENNPSSEQWELNIHNTSNQRSNRTTPKPCFCYNHHNCFSHPDTVN